MVPRTSIARLAGCLFLIAMSGCGRADNVSSDRTESASAKAGGRVFLIGLDGADWEIIDRLEAQGGLPNIARLRRDGAWGVLRSSPPLLSPIVWTSIATGRTPAEHGIVGFLTSRNGKTQPVGSDERRVRAFWNILTDLGASVGVIGWYASWPAENVNGFLVSDRVASHQIEGTAGQTASGLVHPASLTPDIQEARAQVDRAIGPSEAARYFSAGSKGTGGSLLRVEEKRLKTFVGVLRTTELYRRLTPMLDDRFAPAFSAVYFEGTDAVGHLFAEFAPPALPNVDPDDAAHFGQVFDRYYETIDGIVGELAGRLDPARTTLMIVSDHGFRTGSRRPHEAAVTAYANQAPVWHRPEGILLLWGKGVKAGARLPESRIYDVLPTAFRLLDLPLASNLAGRPVEAALTSDVLERPVKTVADYEQAGKREPTVVADIGSDEEMEKLRALGYIGSSPESPAGGPHHGATPPSIPQGQAAVPLNRYNQAIVLLHAGKKEEALEILAALQRDEPGFPLGYLGEGMVRLEEGNVDGAIHPLEKAVKVEPRLAAGFTTLGEAYLRAGREDDARRALARSLQLDPSQTRAALALAQLSVKRRDLEEAKRLFDSVRSSGGVSEQASACVGLAIVAEESRNLEQAESHYEAALRCVADFPPALERYGNLELFRGRAARAVELYARLVAVEREDPQALTMYARALAIAGRNAEARSALEKSLAKNPSQPEARALLGRLTRTPP